LPLGAFLLDNTALLQGGLANAFAEFSANNATELGLGNSAAVFVGTPVDAEPRAIDQGRHNDVASYNDYREAMGLARATSFDEVVGKARDARERTRRSALSARLKALYGHVDNLEFYVGLFAEPREDNGPLPRLITAMVAMDAFSQAFPNPLLSKHIWGNEKNRIDTFTQAGIKQIDRTNTLRDILARNSTNLGDRFVGMTRRDWRRE
jgi:prostaglandin-endoperoxide synthase 2